MTIPVWPHSIPVWLISQDLIFIPILLVGLALGVAWLANITQPKPHPDHWEWIDGRTDWKKTVR